jgi:tRNA nucleotidyltransferase (CCA-adding enzyme)
MAVRLDPDHIGEIIDLFEGRKDLNAGLIRVLHPLSFQDDATRIWRAVRYEQRLNFQIENETRALILKDIAFIDKLSPDRQRNELELCLEEKSPEKVLARAVELGLFQRLVPFWQVSPRTFQNIQKARTLTQPSSHPQELYLAILFFGLNQPELQTLVKRFNFNRSASLILQDSLVLKDSLPVLSEAGLSNSQIYHLLAKINQISLLAVGVILDSGLAKERIDLYLSQLRQVKTMLSGDDLLQAGYPPGPEIGQILEKLKVARLEGRVTTLEDEKALIKQISQADD